MTHHENKPSADAAGQPERILDVSDLTVTLSLNGKVVNVIEEVSFSLARGEILGVVGESGSGKSITALSVMRMLPKAAGVAAGTVRYRDKDLLGLSASEMTGLRGSEIGMVFQDPMAFLNPLMRIGQQLREALELHGMPSARAKERAVELLKLVGVREAERRVDDYPHQFSGGMRQRVIIALAVANNPQLLIADEPTTALDVTVQQGILELLRSLRDEFGMGMMLITHDIGIVKDVCDTVMVMYGGRIQEYGPVSEVLERPRHPYTRELMRSTPQLDVPRMRQLPTIPGQPPDVLRRPGGCPFHPRCPLAIDKCVEVVPLLLPLAGDAGHTVACHRAEETVVPPVVISEAPAPAVDLGGRSQILSIQDARISYGSRGLLGRGNVVEVVKGVSLEAYSGRTLGLVGESGCGKSTLARTVLGLQPLAGGSILIDGMSWQEADAQQRRQLRRTVQMVFQDPYQSLNPRQTIRDILTEPLIVHDIVPRQGLSARVDELMSLVGLPKSLLERYPYQLSGGQRQRVGIARALSVEPKLVVADEPVSALDVSVQAQIVNLLSELRDELGLALVVIAHDLSVVRHLCDEVAVMQQGVIVERSDSDTLFSTPEHPYTRSLLAAIPGSPWIADQPGGGESERTA